MEHVEPLKIKPLTDVLEPLSDAQAHALYPEACAALFEQWPGGLIARTYCAVSDNGTLYYMPYHYVWHRGQWVHHRSLIYRADAAQRL